MNIPIDRNRPFVERDYPRDPNEYTPHRHFIQRYKEDRRFLNSEIIESAITDGDLRDNNDGCACFRLERGKGVAYYLIAGFHKDGYRILITAWPCVHSRRLALKSDMWDEEQLDRIEKFNDKTSEDFEVQYSKYNEWLKQ